MTKAEYEVKDVYPRAVAQSVRVNRTLYYRVYTEPEVGWILATADTPTEAWSYALQKIRDEQ